MQDCSQGQRRERKEAKSQTDKLYNETGHKGQRQGERPEDSVLSQHIYLSSQD